MEPLVIFLVVVLIVMLVGQPWRKRGRDTSSNGYFPWSDTNSPDGSNHHHGGGHHGYSDGGGHSGGHGGGDCGGGHGGH